MEICGEMISVEWKPQVGIGGSADGPALSKWEKISFSDS